MNEGKVKYIWIYDKGESLIVELHDNAPDDPDGHVIARIAHRDYTRQLVDNLNR